MGFSVLGWIIFLRRFDVLYGKNASSTKTKLMMWLIPTFIFSALLVLFVHVIKIAILTSCIIAVCFWLIIYAVLFPYKNTK